MIDLAAVRTLDAVREHGSVVAAAAALGYTPSAVSQQIKRLERHTGVQLLERVGDAWLLNPGELMGMRSTPSWALYDTEEHAVAIHHV